MRKEIYDVNEERRDVGKENTQMEHLRRPLQIIPNKQVVIPLIIHVKEPSI